MNTPWDLLELEPTGDALAIKRAYARQLKNHRPDDAAQAYQALREAYEWALTEADWIRQSLTDTDEVDHENESFIETADQPPPPADFAPVPKLPVSVNTDSDLDGIEFDHAQALLERWAERLRSVDAVAGVWPTLRNELDALPLEQQAAASALFADFVLQHEALSTDLLVKMAQHFQWGRDYRDAERLGAFRLAQLRERLIAEAPASFRSAHQIERAMELLRLDWVLKNQGKFYGWVYAVLARPVIRRLMAETPDLERKALEISYDGWETMSAAATQAIAIRLFLVLACVILITKGFFLPSQQNLFGWLVVAGLFGVAYWLAAWGIAWHLRVAAYLQEKLASLSWMQGEWGQPAAGIGLPLAIALIARDKVALPALQAVIPDEGLILAAGLGYLLALLIKWPSLLEERVIYLPMVGILAFGLTSLTGADGVDWVVAVGVAVAWTGLGEWVYVRYHEQVIHIYGNPWAVLRPRAWWGWVLLVLAFRFILAFLALLFVLALPVTLRVIARYLSANMALLAIGLAVALPMLADPGKAASNSLIVLVISAAVLTWMQALAGWISRKLFSKVPVTFPLNND